ncbi:YbjQ family protein [Peptostreptococcaceae bacterium AGR-M142]
MVLVNTDFISGKEIETLGLVKGSTIQAKNFGSDFLSGLKNLVGGELGAYTDMLNQARDIATKRMIEEAKIMSADGIINIRFATSEIMQGAAEIMVYGTAVKFK